MATRRSTGRINGRHIEKITGGNSKVQAWDPLEGSLEEPLGAKVGLLLGDALVVVRRFGHCAVH